MITLQQAIEQRHSVRDFTDKRIDDSTRHALEKRIIECNEISGLHMQLICNEPKAFTNFIARYGKFKNVRNYLVIAGPDQPDTDELGGFFGQEIALYAQQLGLNSCWVALSFSRKFVKPWLAAHEKLVCVIALGYGTTPGQSHRIKRFEQVAESKVDGLYPTWFKRGVEAALLAPTAINQQKFRFVYESAGTDMPAGSNPREVLREIADATSRDTEVHNTHADNSLPAVSAYALSGPYSNIDLGIAKYNFMIGAGAENFRWIEHQSDSSKRRATPHDIDAHIVQRSANTNAEAQNSTMLAKTFSVICPLRR